MKLAPSILAADMADMAAGLRTISESGCDMVHFDVMDGHFVPNLTFGAPVVHHARKHSKLPFDVHLMVTNPFDHVDALSGLDLEILSFQIETTNFAPRLVGKIREQGWRPSVALNPQTPLTSIEEILPIVDNVLIMSVDPGFAGQSFIREVYTKIEKLSAYRDDNDLVFTIQVDGGVNENNADELAGSGVNIVVAGSAFFKSNDKAAFRERIRRAGSGR